MVGILTSFTPCILPMLPITLGVIGAKNTKSTFHSFTLSITYVLGIAITYSILGVIAAMTGSLFGSLLQNPYVISSIAILFILMGFSMLDVFYVQVPSSIQTRLSNISQTQKKGSYFGVALMGLISGLIATPCVGPVVVTILTYVAQTKNIFLGFWLLFFFAIGMGLILIIFGTLSNRMIKMPKAGAWTETVKKIIGLLMFAIAFYYVKPILPYNIFTLFLGAFIVIISTFFGAFNKLEDLATNSMKFQKGLSVLVLSTGIYLFINSIASKDLLGSNIISVQEATKTIDIKKDELNWYKTESEGFQVAKSEDKYIMIDFYADWCPACIELDKYTYTDKDVIRELDSFTPIKIDSTKLTPEIKDLFKKYGVIGLPAVIFIDKQGKVLEDYTLSGFEKPSEFIKRIKAIKSINTDKVG